MADFYNIPLGRGNQEFELKLCGESFRITLVYRGFWAMDIVRLSDQVGVYGVALRLNTDALEQFHYLGFGHIVMKRTDGRTEEPEFSDMGGENVLLQWSGDDE